MGIPARRLSVLRNDRKKERDLERFKKQSVTQKTKRDKRHKIVFATKKKGRLLTGKKKGTRETKGIGNKNGESVIVPNCQEPVNS